MKTALWQCCALVAKWEDVTVLTSHLLDERWGEGNWKGQSWWQPCSHYKLEAQNAAIWKIIQRNWNLFAEFWCYYCQFRFFRKTKRNSNPWFRHVCFQTLWKCFWWNWVWALCTAILLHFSDVHYTERFNAAPHMSLRYSNSFLLQTLILIILYKYGYYYLPILIKVINFKAHVPQYIRCENGKHNHTWLSILWSKWCRYL